MNRLWQRLRWRNLSIRVKLGIVFGLQLLLIVALGTTSLLALRAEQRQRQTLRDAQGLASLSSELELEFVAAREQHVRFLFGWNDFGYEESVQRFVPAYQSEIGEIRGTVTEVEDLLADSSLSGAPRALSDARTLAAVADFYEEQFMGTVDLAGQLAGENTGRLAQLQQHRDELWQAARDTGNPGLIDRVSTMFELEDRYLSTGQEENLAPWQAQLGLVDSYLSGLVSEGSETAAPQEYLRTQELLQSYHDAMYGVEEVRTTYNDRVASLDALIVEAEPIWVELGDLANGEAADAATNAERIGADTNLAIGLGIGVAIVLGSLITTLLWRGFSDRLRVLTAAALRLEAGDLGARANVIGWDEFGQLSTSFNAMASQLEGTVSGLEAQTAERARALEIIADISRAITSLRDPNILLSEVVELIQERFGFYHAQVFLVGETKQYAVLRASTGEAGRELLARGHRLGVGSRSVIGQVAARGEPVVALDTDVDPVHRRNELLPDTRSEMALPMRIGEEVIGALDVQSVEPDAFGPDEVAAFQTMADQLAVALRNAQLFEEAQRAIGEVEALNRRIVGQAWSRFEARRHPDAPRAYRIEGEDVLPEKAGLPPEVLDRAARGGALVRLDGEENGELQVAVPIRVRGEVIGAFGFGGEELQDLSQDDIALIEAVAERVGVALESARLFEQTQQQAHREQLVNQITSKIVGSTDVTDILQTTARELGKVLRSPRTSIQLRGDQDDE